MVSNKDLEDVVAQVNKAYERMNKRITALEEAAKTPKKDCKKDLTFRQMCGIVRRYITY